ncbi:MAG TPA: alkaline phosphatase family protein [Ktedonobacteraceae bacterium]|nr:alkaline phosphatase family protein [Ktedonobacteraceae bacterium]
MPGGRVSPGKRAESGTAMLNAASVQAVNSAKFSQQFSRPLYDSYCFSNLPATVLYLLTGAGRCALPPGTLEGLPTRFDAVMLLFVDGFGWRFFERYAEKYAFLRTFMQQGIVSKMTSQFPSTTAAHVTCIHTGLPVGQSGIYEWNYYEPLVDEMITPLLFAYAGDNTRDTLKRAALPAEMFFPRQTFYQELRALGVASYVFQNAAFTPSTPSNVLFRGATVAPFKRIDDALQLIARMMATPRASPTYYFLYQNAIDTAGHNYGPNSREFEQEVHVFFTAVEQGLADLLKRNSGKTLLLMTADHGQMEVDPRSTCYLNQQFPSLIPMLRANRQGKALVPAGSARDMFLHVKDERLDEALALLQRLLKGRAEVYLTRELIAQGLFGAPPLSAEFLARVGNVVILPYRGETVWWYEHGRFDMHFRGHHGGLSPEEMEIPLLAMPL